MAPTLTDNITPPKAAKGDVWKIYADKALGVSLLEEVTGGTDTAGSLTITTVGKSFHSASAATVPVSE